MRTLSAVVVVMGLLGTACPAPKPELPSGTPVRLELSPAAVLLEREGATRPLTVRAFAADGTEVAPGAVTWRSSKPEHVTVDAAGTLTAVGVGSSQVTATVGTLEVTTAVASARAVEGAVLVRDAQVGAITPADPAVPFGLGLRYRVALVGVTPPAVGAVLLASEAAPVAGKVVAVSGETVTLEVVPLAQLFTAFSFRETFTDLPAAMPARTRDGVVDRPAAADGTASYGVKQQGLGSEFEVGPFDCEAETELPFALAQSAFSVKNNPTWDLQFDDQVQRLVISDSIALDVVLEPQLRGELNGKLECKLPLASREIPVPGPVGLLFGVVLEAGVGFGLEAKSPVVPGLSVLVNVKARGSARVGVDCVNYQCTGVNEVELQQQAADVTSKVEVKLPENFPELELTAGAFAFLDLKAGVTAFRRFPFGIPNELEADVVGGKLGLQASATIATEARQVEKSSFSSKYSLGFHGEVAAGKSIDAFARLVGLAVGPVKKEFLLPLGASPRAAVSFNQPAFVQGDTVEATVKFDPATVSFPLVGDNLEEVRLVRKVTHADAGVGLVLMARAPATAGQLEYALSGVALEDGSPRDYVVFVTSKLWPSLSLEQEPRCVVPAGFSYCLVDLGAPFFAPTGLRKDGTLVGKTLEGASPTLGTLKNGVLTVYPRRTLPPAPNPVEPTDIDERGRALYGFWYGTDAKSWLFDGPGDGGVTFIDEFVGKQLTDTGVVLGGKHFPESSPGAEDDYLRSATWDGTVTLFPDGVSVAYVDERGVACGARRSGQGATAELFPGGPLPSPAGFSYVVATLARSATGVAVGYAVDPAIGAPTYVAWRDGGVTLLGTEPVVALNAAGRALSGVTPTLYEVDGGVVLLEQVTHQVNGRLGCGALGDDDVVYCQRVPADGGTPTAVRLEPALVAP